MRRSGRGVAGRRAAAGVAEQPEIHDAVVSRQEIQETLIVVRFDAEQRQQPHVAAAGIGQTEVHQFAEILSRDVARQKKRLHVIPEGIAGACQRFVQFVCNATCLLYTSDAADE